MLQDRDKGGSRTTHRSRAWRGLGGGLDLGLLWIIVMVMMMVTITATQH